MAALAVGVFLCNFSQAARPGRVANTSLSLPLEPPSFGFTVKDDFPELLFSKPVAALTPEGETNRLFVVEQGGVVQVVTNLTQPDKTVFLDISDRVVANGEGGLLSLAFHPGYSTNGYLYAFYTTYEDSVIIDRLSRFEVNPENPADGLEDSEVIVLSQEDRAWYHNGGALRFGPDGYLYLGVGDEADGYDPYGNSQRIDKDFFSGLLRLDVDMRAGNLPPNGHPASSAHYLVPADNPYVGLAKFNGQWVDPSKVRTEFFASGLRNPWRISFDALTGDLYASDVGQLAREEMDFLVKGGNYGWVAREGTLIHSNRWNDIYTNMFYIPPIAEYRRDMGNAVAGALLYRGDRYAQLDGAFLFGDYVSGRIGAIRYVGSETHAQVVELEQAMNQLRMSLSHSSPAIQLDQANWEAGGPVSWEVLVPESFSTASSAMLVEQPDYSLLATGSNPWRETYEIVAHVASTNIIGLRLEVIPDPSLPQFGPGRGKGNFVLSGIKVFAAPLADLSQEVSVRLSDARADFTQAGWNVRGTLDESASTGWAINPERGRMHHADFTLEQPVGFVGGTRFRVELEQQYGATLNIGRFRLQVTTDPRDLDEEHPNFAVYLLGIPPEARTQRQNESLAAYYRAIAPALKTEWEHLRSLEMQLTKAMSTQLLPIEWLASSPGFSSFGIHPASGEILLVNWAIGKLLKLVYDDHPQGDPLPPTLAEAGVFSDPLNLEAHDGILPYDINTPLWSDHARKYRWFSLPDTNSVFGFATDENWVFPPGTVWVKHFEMEMERGNPETVQRLETRLLVKNESGVYGVTYRWDESGTNAVLVPEEGLDELLEIHDDGSTVSQKWRYPSRAQCLQCHTAVGGYALGFNTAQLNRESVVGDEVENQLNALFDLGYLDGGPVQPENLPKMASLEDENTTLTHRVKSYLASNCVQCHQPGGVGRNSWDARFSVSLEHSGLINGLPLQDLGLPDARLVKPGHTAPSVLYHRLASSGPERMPPLARDLADEEALAVFRRWIEHETPAWAARANLPPSGGISLPGAGSMIDISQPVYLELGAVDGDGHLEEVLLYLNGKLVQAWNEVPGKFQLRGLRSGNNELVLQLVDNEGLVSTMEPLEVCGMFPPIIEVASFGPDGAFRLKARGVRDAMGVVEVSGNLIDWIPVASNRFVNGFILYYDTLPVGESPRYFRVFQDVGSCR